MRFSDEKKIYHQSWPTCFPTWKCSPRGSLFLQDWVNAVKEVIILSAPKVISIDSTVERLLSGDENKNGIIDSGDIVTFKYTIINPTDKEISFATLKTNINRKQLNFIHNIKGTSSLNDDGITIEIPNFRIGPVNHIPVK